MTPYENVAAQEFSTVIDLHTVHDDYMAGRIAAHEISGDHTTIKGVQYESTSTRPDLP